MKKIYVIAVLALFIWLMIQFPHIMINPGELAAGHQDLNDQCTKCHDPLRGISSDKCISCHKLSEIGKDSAGNAESISFHEKLEQVECTSCHTEHQGIHPAKALRNFDHSILSESVRAECTSCHARKSDSLHRHVSESCGNCHTTVGWKTDVTFNHSMISETSRNNCPSCHNKPDDAYHSGVTGNCSECHSTERWVPSTFDHSMYFALDGDHNAACKTCHTNNIFTAYTCYGCHEHSESNIREEHQEEGISDFSDCASCHRSGDEHDIERNSDRGGNNGSNEADQIEQYIDKQKEGKKDKDQDDDHD